MPIGYFKSVPKVEISLDKESYKPGDELLARVTVQTERPGMKVPDRIRHLRLRTVTNW